MGRSSAPRHRAHRQPDVSFRASLSPQAVPRYVDFSPFGPHGKRMLDNVSLRHAHLRTCLRQLAKARAPRAADINAWWKYWRVFRTAFLLLGLVCSQGRWACTESTPARTLSENYMQDDCSRIYLAAVRALLEEWVRIRRKAILSYENLRASGAPCL